VRLLEVVAVGVVFDSCLGLGGKRERRERKRERGFEKHPSSQAIDRTRSFRRGDLTLRALSPLTLNPGVGPDARTKRTVPTVAAVLGDVHFVTVMGWATRREEFKLALLPSWDLTLSYSRFNRDGFCSYSAAFGSSLAVGGGRGLVAGCSVG